MGEVTKFYPKNATATPDTVLELAVGELDSVIVLGRNEAGDVDFRCCEGLAKSRGEIFLLLEVAKMMVLESG